MNLVLTIVLFASIPILPQSKADATIHRLIETREGRKSIWGVTVQLDKLSFRASIDSSQLSIIEAKESHELKGIMVWHVDKSRKKLVIKFKKGCGDFGTGNIVQVTINASALVGKGKHTLVLSTTTPF